MHVRPLLLAALLLAAIPALADESGSFIVRLGRDTTFAERYTRAPGRLVVEHVGRSPRVLQRRFTYEYEGGELRRIGMVVTPPGFTTPTQTIEGSFGPDSARIRIQTAGAPPRNIALALPPGTLVVPGTSPWAGYEGLLMRLTAERRDTLRTDLYLLGGTDTWWLRLQRLGRDSVAITNGRNDRLHVRVDPQGRILGVLPVAGTGRYSVERVDDVDVPALAAAFAARELAGSGLGSLSPRDSVVTTVAGAALWIDYGRPAKRGRAVFGDLVPYGQVWRTGANAATQFRTDRALDFGGTVVPAGFYTLWTVPSRDGWTLRFNGETGQWGTAHKPDRDLYSVTMKVTSLPVESERFTIGVEGTPRGGILYMDWDRTRASVAFTVQP